MIVITYADYEDAELDGYVPASSTSTPRNRVIDEASAALDAELAVPLAEPA